MTERIEASREKIRMHDSDLRQYRKEEENYKNEIDLILQQLDQTDEILRYEGHNGIAEAVRQGRVREALREKSKELKELSDTISRGLEALREFGKMEEAWSQAEEELSQLGIKKSTCEEQLKTAEGMETRSRDELVETFYRIAENLRNGYWKSGATEIYSWYKNRKDLGEITQVLSRIRLREKTMERKPKKERRNYNVVTIKRGRNWML